MPSEAEIHFELYRHLQNSIEQRPEYHSTTYSRAQPELTINGGYADIVLFDNRDSPVLVIEAKRGSGPNPNRDIDPYSPKVIEQAFHYAGHLGANFFATYNGRHCVIFRTFEEGRHLLERRTRGYSVTDAGKFAKDLLAEIDGLRGGTVAWDPHHRAFTSRLRVYHERLTEAFEVVLPDCLEADGEPIEPYKSWIANQGWTDDYENDQEAVNHRYSAQAAYLLMNKLVFYKLLEDTSAYDVPRVYMQDLANPESRRAAFDRLINALDFEAVYQHDQIFGALPLTEVAKLETKELLDQLETFDLGEFDHDVIGQVYQRIIPPEERHDLGQYYTPPEVVDLITRLTITSPDDLVMDPACGSGGFLVGAYKRLKSLTSDPEHQEILDQLKGFDVNRFPAHLTAINLALQNLSEETQNVGVEVEDFFLVEAGQKRITFGSRAGIRGAEEDMGEHEVGLIDAVVGNPPYIRQEQIASKNRCREHLDRVEATLGKRSDIYAYFFTHAVEFMKPGSRLGFITSDRWLSVKYGEELQRFMLKKFKIKAIINFTRQQFELALISTCVVVLERCDDAGARDSNIVKLLQLKEEVDTDDVVSIVEDEHEPNRLKETDKYRLATLTQANLHGEKKWGRYLWAPTIYWAIMKQAELVTLDEIGRIQYGIKTGANSFFYFRERSDWEEWGIPREFVRPLLKHPAEMEYTSLREEDLSWWALDVHWFIEEQCPEGVDSEDVKEALADAGHMNLVEYIRWGERKPQEYYTRASIEGRPVWFDLGELPTPPLALIEVYWRECKTVLNEAGAAFDKRLYCLWAREDIDERVLAGILNSSLYAMMRELHGRTEQGEGMNRNTLMVYEARDLPIPDPRTFEPEKAEAIREAFDELIDKERTVNAEEKEELHDDLDTAVMAALGLEDRTKDVQQAAALLLKAREMGAGQFTDVLVRTEEIEQELAGAERVEGGPGQQISLDL